MKRVMAVLGIIVMLFTFSIAVGEGSAENGAVFFMERFCAGEYEEIFENMTDQMQEALPVAALASLSSLGEIASWEIEASGETAGYTQYMVHASQTTGEYTWAVVLDAEGKLAGLQILPWAGAVEEDKDVYTEEITLRSGAADETGGILTLPDGEGPFPAVILIAGSGPSDRNETVNGLAPMLDLAEGLAKAGIASIRYDKYTYAHSDIAAADPYFTVEKEYFLDAKDALELLKADERIGSIYIIGHSQSGMLLPRLLTVLDDSRVKGGIMLAGTPLHFWEIQYDQNLAVLDSIPEDQLEAANAIIEAEKEKALALANLEESEIGEDTVFGLPAYYQWDEIRYDAAELANALSVPMLAIQGDSDWQVTQEEGIESWRKLCPNVETVLLPQISHLMTRVEEPTGTIADYAAGSRVDEIVIQTIAEWILGQ